MANLSDKKMALFSLLLTMGSEEDLDRTFQFSLHLLKKRNHERAQRQLRFLREVEGK